MPESIAFERLTIEGFRGFNEPTNLDLNASAIVLTGPNGSGKTSVFDAILWLLTGKLERLRELRTHERDEWIINQYWTKSQARVSADLRIGMERISIDRSGGRRKSILRLTEGQIELEAERAERRLEELFVPAGRISLEDLLTTSGLLQQDLMERFVTENAGERFRLLNQLLGLNILSGFQTATQEHAKSKKEIAESARETYLSRRQDRLALETGIVEIERQQQLLPPVDSALGTYLGTLARHQGDVTVTVDLRANPGEVARVLAELKRLRRVLSELEDGLTSIRSQVTESIAQQRVLVEEATKALSEARTYLDQSQSEQKDAYERLATAERRSQDISQLAARAIPMLTNTCPVCGQDITHLDVATHLNQLAGDVAELVELRGLRDQTDRKVAEANDRVRRAQAAFEIIDSQRVRQQRLQQRLEQSVLDLTMPPTSESRVRLLAPPTLDDVLTFDSSRLAQALSELEQSIEQLNLVLLSSAVEEQLRNLRAQLVGITERQQSAEIQLQTFAQSQAETDTLFHATQNACLAVGQRRAKALQPLVADIFSRLDPHPPFKTLDLSHEMYRAKAATVPMVTDPIEGKSVNPALVFSTSQVNITALSVFLALSFGAGEAALPFVLLDDPLQSLDDVNVLAFADLCRFIREGRQLILSTHDRRFANLLIRKLAPRHPEQSTTVIRFSGWERTGPTFETQAVPPQLGIPRLVSA